MIVKVCAGRCMAREGLRRVLPAQERQELQAGLAAAAAERDALRAAQAAAAQVPCGAPRGAIALKARSNSTLESSCT